MEPVSEEALLSAFSDSERTEEIFLPDVSKLDWEHLDYLGWIHPSGHLGYVVLVSPNDAELRGVILKRSRFSGRKPGFEMCSLCHHVHQPNGTAMFTLMRKDSDRHHSIGNIVCKNLDCSLQIRNLTNTASHFKETLYLEAKIWRMQLALHKWLKSADCL